MKPATKKQLEILAKVINNRRVSSKPKAKNAK